MSPRRAFTLVELLVVAAIFSVLLGLALNGARPSLSSQVRQAAQSIASVLLATQSKALGSRVGAGVVLEPMVTGTTPTSVITISAADMLPLVTGACGLTPLTGAIATGTIWPDNAAPAELADAYRIQFFRLSPAQPPSAWFGYVSGSSGTTTATGTIVLRASNGQTALNTIWPASLAGGPLQARVSRYPSEGDTLYDLPKGVVIDLRYSGIGEDAATVWNEPSWVVSGTAVSGWGNLGGKGAVALTFDSVGGLDALMQRVLGPPTVRVDPPTHPVSPVYLLVALASDVVGNTSLANERSMWVVVHPQTGRVSVAANVAVVGTDAAALRAARANARAQVAIGK